MPSESTKLLLFMFRLTKTVNNPDNLFSLNSKIYFCSKFFISINSFLISGRAWRGTMYSTDRRRAICKAWVSYYSKRVWTTLACPSPYTWPRRVCAIYHGSERSVPYVQFSSFPRKVLASRKVCWAFDWGKLKIRRRSVNYKHFFILFLRTFSFPYKLPESSNFQAFCRAFSLEIKIGSRAIGFSISRAT